jgi:signal transduction histidine kinase
VSIILFIVYPIVGLGLAMLASMFLGFLLSAFIALSNIFAYRKAWALLFGYLMGCVVCFGIICLVLWGLGFLGNQTGYKLQILVAVGAIFPGILMFKLIPTYVRDAARHTRGNFEDLESAEHKKQADLQLAIQRLEQEVGKEMAVKILTHMSKLNEQEQDQFLRSFTEHARKTIRKLKD